MSRAVWFVAGATAGVYAMVKARRAAEAFTPDGMRDRLAGLSLGAHLFTEDVRAEMAVRETQLRERLELAQSSHPLTAIAAGNDTSERKGG